MERKTKIKGIRLSGPPLGRRKKDETEATGKRLHIGTHAIETLLRGGPAT